MALPLSRTPLMLRYSARMKIFCANTPSDSLGPLARTLPIVSVAARRNGSLPSVEPGAAMLPNPLSWLFVVDSLAMQLLPLGVETPYVYIITDGGPENLGKVDELLKSEARISRLIAQADIVYSNSLIELGRFWRDLKDLGVLAQQPGAQAPSWAFGQGGPPWHGRPIHDIAPCSNELPAKRTPIRTKW